MNVPPFKNWRLCNKLSQREAAAVIGRSRGMVQHYDKYRGLHDLPPTVRKAMHAAIAKARE